jgi:DNA-binding transcriptional regulator YiaG
MTPDQIRALRNRLKLSPEDFAAAFGFTGNDRRITVWRWDTGKRMPSHQTVMLMKQLALPFGSRPPRNRRRVV